MKIHSFSMYTDPKKLLILLFKMPVIIYSKKCRTAKLIIRSFPGNYSNLKGHQDPHVKKTLLLCGI